MKYLARMLAIAGFVLAVALFVREDVRGIVDLVIAAGPGLVVAGLFHFFPMIANARAWQRLLPSPRRPSLRVLTWAIWVRESVNGLLPVARVGGEIVAYRVLRRHVALQSEAAASLVVDMALSILSQAGFALLGLGLLFAVTHTSVATTQLLLGVACMIPLGAGFVLAQRCAERRDSCPGSAFQGQARIRHRSIRATGGRHARRVPAPWRPRRLFR